MKVFRLPDVGEGLAEARIHEWHIQKGQEIKEDQLLVTIETEKSLVEIPSPYCGSIDRLHAKQDEIIAVDSPLVSIRTTSDSVAIAGSLSEHSLAPASPIDDYSDHPTPTKQTHTSPHLLLTGWKQLIHTSIFDEAIIENWPEHRDTSAFLCWALAKTLEKHIHLNGYWNTKTQTFSPQEKVFLGYAIDDNEHILLPVLNPNDLQNTKSIRDAFNAFKKRKTKSNTYKPTIIASNIGPIAGKYATPNLMPPANIIIAFGRIYDKPIAVKRSVQIARVLPLSLTFNHRICTGAQGARFMADFLTIIQL